MRSVFRFLLDPRVLAALGLICLATFLFLGAEALQLGLRWAVLLLLGLLLLYGLSWLLRKALARRAAQRLADGIQQQGELAEEKDQQQRAAVGQLRKRLNEALKTLNDSRLGQRGGKAALYELPWYLVVGNPAAGKSSAILHSGLNFPFADQGGGAVRGIGGTRNCDWFFTREAILLDTAGRYAVQEEDRSEWLGFLQLLKRARPLAPINGILLAVSASELMQASPEDAQRLAKNLRERVQELTERLAIFAPVYLVFTKMDLVAGFNEFFATLDEQERRRIWGATLSYKPGEQDSPVSLFDHHFELLREGLKETMLANMTLARGEPMPAGVLSFPLEFGALQSALRAFVATLFDDNPYQHQPVLRGFYFTSALQEGESVSWASSEVSEQFGLSDRSGRGSARPSAARGTFLHDLFTKVVFADRELVRQYASPRRQQLRWAAYAGSALLLGLALGAWTWSYVGNRQLMQEIDADLRKVAALQVDRSDLASRLEALELLQQRLESLQALSTQRPIGLGFGLYQGEAFERKLRAEYFEGLRQLMLEPVARQVEGYLQEVLQHAAELSPASRPPQSGAAALAGPVPTASAAAPARSSRYADADPARTDDAYNALKTYLMLAEPSRVEASHLRDQLTRFWRAWLEEQRGEASRDGLMRSAERVMAFTMTQLNEPGFPVLRNNLALVDQSREVLRKVMRGMPAKERVYAEIKARAATRYAPMTVSHILAEAGLAPAGEAGARPSVHGSHSISGAFTHEAWRGYVEAAIKEAATTELQRVDWVLNVAASDDLSLEGSPAQIRAALAERYKTEYVQEWQRFLQAVGVAEFSGLKDAAQHMNLLGDPLRSPLRKVLEAVHDQTAWDNPGVLNARLKDAQGGFMGWLQRSLNSLKPASADVNLKLEGGPAAAALGPIGREFAVLNRLMHGQGGEAPAIKAYFESLAKLRARFNSLLTEGDPGPGARKLVQATLEGGDSEIAAALKLVDEQLMVGLNAGQRAVLRPLLVRPLMSAYAAVLPTAELEINRRWEAEVHAPFQRSLANKYPFDAAAKVEAAASDIGKVFGPEGAIAKFGQDALGGLVLRRGDQLEVRQWAEIGLRLQPAFLDGFPRWVAPLDGAAGAGGEPGAAAAQYAFQILPLGAPGLLEYSIEIDGQQLRYRNGAAAWTDFVWPNPGATPGVRVSGLSHEGKRLEFLEIAGAFGLERMLQSAKVTRLGHGVSELSWAQGSATVSVQLRLVRTPGSAGGDAAAGRGGGGGLQGLRGLRLPAAVVGLERPRDAQAGQPS